MSEFSREGGLTSTAAQNAQGTVLWLRIVAIVNLISQALNVVFVLLLMAKTPFGQQQLPSTIVSVTIGVILAIKLWQQAAAIQRFSDSNNLSDYEESIKHESVYWMIVGVIMILAAAIVLIFGLIFLTNMEAAMDGMLRSFF